jgi:hypothetical protein
VFQLHKIRSDILILPKWLNKRSKLGNESQNFAASAAAESLLPTAFVASIAATCSKLFIRDGTSVDQQGWIIPL